MRAGRRATKGNATSGPALVLLTGATATGKSSAARQVISRYGAQGRCVIVEHDIFADWAGRLVAPRSGDIANRIWQSALPAAVAATRTYLRAGFSVLLVLTYGRKLKRRLARVFRPFRPQFVLITADWPVTEARRIQRTQRGTSGELEAFDWESHRRLHAELTDMAAAGQFDAVIDTTNLTPEEAADRLAAPLGLQRV